MPTQYHQAQIIKVLNQYLDYHHLPEVYRLHPEGICNGLASLYARYVLEKKGDEFLGLLKYMSEKNHDAEWDEKVNQFVIEVLKYASPHLFTHTIGQTTSHHTTVIDGRNITISYKLGLITTAANWASIVTDLNLADGEVMLVKSLKHSSAISRSTTGEYIVYDPDYTTGVKPFTDEKTLLNELRDNVFEYKNDNIGLSIEIIRPADSPPKKYPKVNAIYNQYIPQNSNLSATRLDSTWHMLNFAARISDTKAIKKLLHLNEIGGLDFAITQLIHENRTNILPLLLQKASFIDKLTHLLKCAKMGKSESLDCILKNLKVTLPLIYEIILPSYFMQLIHYAAEGGNQSILKKILDCIKEPNLLLATIFEKDKNNKDTLMHAICSTSAACLIELLNTLDEHHQVLTPEQQLEYLSFAIKQNNPIMVETLLTHGNNRMPIKLLATIELPFTVLERTDVYLLQNLQQHGVHFSASAQAMIDKKMHRDVGVMLSIGIVLMQFTDWLRDIWDEHISLNLSDKHLIFRQVADDNEPTEETIHPPDNPVDS